MRDTGYALRTTVRGSRNPESCIPYPAFLARHAPCMLACSSTNPAVCYSQLFSNRNGDQ